MILWRAGQGFTGGVLIPTAITIVRSRAAASKQPIGVAMFGMVATFAPAIGPTVGGWLTENCSWHYIFYLNVAARRRRGRDPARAALDKERPQLGELRGADWLGIASMAIGLGSLIFVLEEGQREEWFGSRLIVAADDRCGHRHRGVPDRRADGRQAVHQPPPVQATRRSAARAS